MATYNFISTFFLQISSDWRPDIPSLILGFILGILLLFGLLRLQPFIQNQVSRAKEWAQGRLSWMRSGVEVRFLGETAVYTEKHHLGSQWAELSSIFVAPRFLNPLRGDLLKVNDRGATQMALLWPDLAAEIGTPSLPSSSLDQLLQNGRRVIIGGQAGAGKSTLLAYIANRLAEAGADDKAKVRTVPVLVHLAELQFAEGTTEPEDSNPIDVLTRAMQKRSSPLTATGIGDMLQRKFKSGEALLLIDGWDEIAAERRPLVIDWLRTLLSAHKKTRIFMAAGLTGYGDLLPFGFVLTRIMSWRLGEVERFLAKWTAVLDLEEIPELSMVWRPGQTPLETSLRLWLTALVGHGERPSTLTELLQVTLPLFQQRKKGEPLTPPDDDVQEYWQLVAARLKQTEGATLPREIVAECAAALSPGEEGEMNKSQASRLQKSIGSCHLFVRWGAGGIGFISPIWLDYFMAASLQSGLSMNADSQLQNPKWKNVWRFYAGLGDPTPQAQKVLAADGEEREGRFQTAGWLCQTTVKGKWVRQTMIDLGHMARQTTNPPALRLRALAAMVRTQEEGLLKFVNQLLAAPDSVIRQFATAVLPLIKEDEIIGLLAEQLTDEDPHVRLTAVDSLALLQHKPLAEGPLVTALIGEDEEVELRTAELLALNGGAGFQILKEAAEEEDIQVRRVAVHGLASVDEDWVEPMLVDIERHDDEWFVRSAATGALEMIRERRQPHPWRPAQAADQFWLGEIAFRTGEPVPSGRAAVPYIIKVLEDAEEDYVKIAAIYQLAQIPSQNAIQPLEQLRQNEAENMAVREAATFTYTILRQAFEC